MNKFHTVVIVLACLLFPLGEIDAKNTNGNDSLLIKQYWNRINITSITSKGNNLYNGIDNYIQLVFPDKASSTFHYYISTNNGNIYEYDETSYLTIPKSSGRSFFSIYIITENNDTLMIAKKQLNVLNLPLPSLKIGNTVISEQTLIKKEILLGGDTLKVFFTEDIPESVNWYKIERFSVGYIYGTIYVSADNNGPIISDEAKNLLNKIRPGIEINIKINSVSPSGLLKNLPLVKFKVY
jgi:hypothetical protein